MRPTIQRSLSWEEPLSTQRALRMETTLRGLNIVALIIVAIAAFLASAPRVYAQAATGALRLVTPGEMRSGALLFRGKEEGRYVQAPIVGTDVDLTVSGPTARARVTQLFHNPTDGHVEAVYVYPLPEGSAVDTLKMVIGDRVVIGELKERVEAKVIYERAKAAGQKATLLEQERPNLFTNSVANIGPGELVLVQIEYQEPVRQSAETFSLRVPLVVAPRYSPAPVAQTVDFAPGQQGWGRTADPVPDRERISPPVLDPRETAPVNPVAITVHLQAGFPLAEVKSEHHKVRIATEADDSRTIKLDGPVPADRDFELTWAAKPSDAPTVGLFRERVGEADYLLAYLVPPTLEQTTDERPREIVFVIDNSGSMGGTSMRQAKASLIYALGRLRPVDRFNVVRFDDTFDVLFPDTVQAEVEKVSAAKAFVYALEAKGGTEMVPAMKAALADPRPTDGAFLRQVVFLTDGAVGNEEQLFDTITGGRGRSRIFMVGIGSAPNTFLMTRASELGRGTFTHIGSTEQVEERMKALFEKLESPAATGLSAVFSAGEADVTPSPLPDLYRGEPIVLAARLDKLEGNFTISGTIGERPWTVTVPVTRAASGQGLSKLWARRKIADAEVGRNMHKLTALDADAKILALALEHHLVTRLTSLVAVDKTPSRPEGQRLTRADVPLNLPAGWDFDKVFGEPPGKARPTRADRAGDPRVTPARAEEGRAYADLVDSTKKPAPMGKIAPGGNGGMAPLPQTATDAEIRMLLGLALCALALALIGIGARRNWFGAPA